ncbi:MAG: NAD(P)/FAD-dependent oxidoreductase [Saprospiraceae bacterium]|nr:NAD(P)/FAD-dependent oxidoreductase [Saprospiraceae bacterium]
MMKKPIVGIIGGGLSGLVTAYYLKKSGINASILEARNRLGGRVHTHYSEEEAPVELGATWLGKKHVHLIQLLEELHLPIYEQFMGDLAIYEPISTSPPQLVQMPYNPDPTYRIKGGTSVLIQEIKNALDNTAIHLHTSVKSINKRNEKIEVQTNGLMRTYDAVVVTLPPKLWMDTISFTPALPDPLVDIAQQTHTWMSESIKVALTYKKPFWKTTQSIGSIFSNTSLISEMYDHSNFEENAYALKGFIGGGYANTTLEERKKRILEQLSRYFGDQVHDYINYHEAIWKHEQYTHSDYDGFILPHQNNGHSIFKEVQWNGSLYIGGSETASAHPGYLDGAVESGKSIAKKIIQNTQSVNSDI